MVEICTNVRLLAYSTAETFVPVVVVVRFKQFPVRVRVMFRVRVRVRGYGYGFPCFVLFVHKSSEANFEGTNQSCPLYC